MMSQRAASLVLTLAALVLLAATARSQPLGDRWGTAEAEA